MKKVMMLVVVSAVLAGCSAKPLATGAESVRLTNRDPKGCEFLGTVQGYQGGFGSGSFTVNEKLEEGALNSARNAVYALGGDTLSLVTNRSSASGSLIGERKTDVSLIGSAFKCGEVKQHAQSAKHPVLVWDGMKIQNTANGLVIDGKPAALDEDNSDASTYSQGLYTFVLYKRSGKVAVMRDGRLEGYASKGAF